MKTTLAYLSLTLLLSTGGYPNRGFAQSATPIDTTEIGRLVRHHVAENQFSGTVLIADQGQPVYRAAFGYGYRAANDTLRPDYHFSIASVTKLFTAIAVLQQVEAGTLSLEDNLDELLPELAIPNADRITVHHLLLHLSGLPNEPDRLYLHRRTPTEMVVESLKNRVKGTFGSFNYNNVDYFLLGLIIERKSDTPWADYVKNRLLEPLGMTQTGFLAYGDYPDDFAYTYSVSKSGKWKQDPFWYIENFYAGGCMYSTAGDLLKLDQALYSNALLNEESRALLAVSYPEHSYAGYSVWNYRYPFIESQPLIMERRGGILGANVVLVRLPELNRTIIILSNNDRFNPDSFGDPSNLREGLIRLVGRK